MPSDCFSGPGVFSLRCGRSRWWRIVCLLTGALLLSDWTNSLLPPVQSQPVLSQPGDAARSADMMWRVQLVDSDATPSLTGRILTEAQDGGLLFEEQSGRIHTLTPERLMAREPVGQPFRRMTADELGEYLLKQTTAEFRIVQTEHYVLCSNTAPSYTEFVGQLLERIHDEYFSFFSDSNTLRLAQPYYRLPIIIQASASDFQEFARRQHPDVSFDDTPGYYSVRDDLVLLLDLSGDRNISSTGGVRRRLASMPRQIATVVHEAVHQLTFNSGLLTRMADNPLWLSEGIAVWFEPASVRSPLLWSRPGQVNPVHHPAFPQFRKTGQLPLTLSELIGSDRPFLTADQVTVSYALSWGLTTWLIRNEREGFDRLLASVAGRKPLLPLSSEERIREFEEAVGKTTDEIQREMIPYVARLRVPR